jgi:glycosyltransferase involved in cell wall biosynthesis
MRILHVINSVDPTGGGPIEGLKQLAAVNRTAGHTVEVASLDAHGNNFIKTCPLQVYALGSGTLTYSYSRRVVPWLRANVGRYDVVVVNGIWQYHSFATWRALRRSSTPYAVFTHGMLDPWFKHTYPLKHLKKWLYWPWADYRVLRDASAVLFTCHEERVLARQSFCLYKVREAVVSYGVATPTGDEDSQRTAFLARYPALHDKRVALFMGRIHRKKACDVLIRAFAATLAADPAWHLVLAGPDQVGWQAELESLARIAGVDRRLTFTGMLSGDLKWGAIRSSEVFVLPSHQENFGIVVAEALVCGVPVLISDKVNIWREVQGDGAGLVDADDVAGTSRMLAQWANMPPSERTAMATNARACFVRRFEVGRAAESFIKILTSIVERRELPADRECVAPNR